MNIAYFDCFAGASGDMILGALLDAGLSLETLRAEIAKLGLDHYGVSVEKVVKKGMGGSQAVVSVDEDHHHHHHRHLHHIEAIIGGSDLDDRVKRDSIHIFHRLAEAEAKVHRTSVEKIHFHEVGAMDAIIDVVGAAAGFAALGIEEIHCSPLHVGSGTVECAHGTLPVPAPATMELIRGIPIYSTGVAGELLTPTGAAILTTLATGFGPLPAMTVEKIGYGAGTSEPAIPNLLRLCLGRTVDETGGYDAEQMAVIETSIDDMSPQIYEHLMERALDMGAMDIFLSPLQMKKNRPGTLVTIICTPDRVAEFSDLLIRETTTIGLRWRVENRIKAKRSFEGIDTEYGLVKLKIARKGETMINLTPEYDDCKRLAREKNVPLKSVISAAWASAAAIYGKELGN
jgi:hypothetical protein